MKKRVKIILHPRRDMHLGRGAARRGAAESRGVLGKRRRRVPQPRGLETRHDRGEVGGACTAIMTAKDTLFSVTLSRIKVGSGRPSKRLGSLVHVASMHFFFFFSLHYVNLLQKIITCQGPR